mmetsp:Transcript_14332/g.19159  ORF Transcript_14332/g.19159 Transcript_14332/m.19159 type:complete len:322 (+) Transcript_14332:32-997(+)|eukprot:CAMPEP_0197326430 /NCGR_PEP_ID=MMETSP0892-20130614/1674_1 /TAXON_ID=44058 ORGANISM="Aureoumbra lagunensis, Strain CCMP1510" /NCGR_SAMPLE_ID=MMETSP0892 /ASSEMBLY_ACC=CAM_ASM_000538 /LENGTH=321 /DNA_ID=CAMNT_0042820481 /DNA_START=1 /DNA_END=966 /DNA_ORIENTATION=+
MGASHSSRCEEAFDASSFDKGEEKLKAPGQFERREEEVKRITNINTFEGVRFGVSKPLTPMFALNHDVILGSSPIPNASSHYKFGATVGDNEGVIMASLDQHGSIEGNIVGTIMGPVQGKLTFYMPNDPKNFVTVADADYNGKNATAQIKIGHNLHGIPGPHAGMSYFQSITPRFALGGEGSCALSPPSPPNLTASAKYHAKTFSSILSYTPPQSGAQDQLSFLYHRIVTPGRVQLASELALQPSTGESQMAAGAEFNLKQSRINLALDGSGKMTSTVETTLSPSARLSFSAEMHLGGGQPDELGRGRDVYKFGYGLHIGQ